MDQAVERGAALVEYFGVERLKLCGWICEGAVSSDGEILNGVVA
jgi:hypothetical protein